MFEELLGQLIKPISDVLLRVIPDANARAAAQEQITQALIAQKDQILQGMLDIAKGQLEVNKTEAASSSMFVAGWRPYIGWVCGLGATWAFLIQPFLVAICAWLKLPLPPVPDVGQLMTLLFGMLGLGGLRTYEKTSGVPDTQIAPVFGKKK